jgi:hypothetical protein
MFMVAGWNGVFSTNRLRWLYGFNQNLFKDPDQGLRDVIWVHRQIGDHTGFKEASLSSLPRYA